MYKKPLLKLPMYILGVSAIVFAFTPYVFAEATVEANMSVRDKTELPPKGIVRKTVKEINDQRKEMNQKIRDERSDLKDQSTTTRKEFNEDARDTRREFRGEARDKIKQAMVVRATRIVGMRIKATIIRLGKIVEKLDKRIAKVKSLGGDTSVAEKNSTDAKVFLSSAQINLDTLISLNASTTDTTVATSTIKATADEANKNIKSAEDSIKKGIESLKSLKSEKELEKGEGVEIHATTTSSATIN